MRVVKAFAREAHQRARFERSVARVFDQSMVEARLQARYNPLIGFLPQVGLAAILLVGGREVDPRPAHDRRVQRLLHLPADAARADAHARHLARRWRSAPTASGARVFQLLDRAPRARPRRPARPPLPAGNGHVRLEGVDDALRRRRPADALRDVDLDVPGGRTVALVGATGSGKTTLAALVARLYDPTAGRVLIDGADLRDGRRRARCAARSRSPATTRSCSARPCTTTSPTRGPTRAARRSSTAARRAAGARLHRAPARRLRHARRRARPDALGRPAPADRDRARDPRRPADPDPRRRDLLGRRDDRAPDPRRAARADGGTHDVHHRPPPLDDRARRRDRRARGRPRRRARHPRRAARRSRRSTARSSRRACPTASS